MSEDLDINGLKRCPLCESNAVKCITGYDLEGKVYHVACYNCKKHTARYKTKKEAIDNWNRRN